VAASSSEDESLANYLRALAHTNRIKALRYVVRPHHLEEIASHLGVARQTAHEHLQTLLESGLVTTRRGQGERGPVVEYVVAPATLFRVWELIGELGDLEPENPADENVRLRTQVSDGGRAGAPRERELPRLVVVHGLRIGSTALLDGPGPWLLGRDPAAHLCVEHDAFASQRHAEIRREGQRFVLRDLHSTNGTFLDWARLGRGEDRPVENGSLLCIGHTLVLLRKPH
jgi:DNA-binding transcriptional ArsR family regulator